MKLDIQSGNISDHEELRTLLLDAFDKLVGEHHQILEPKLPWDGHPILIADDNRRPVLVSFEVDNSQAALVNGLAGIEQLSAALPWINQVYEALGQRQLPPRLIVVSGDAPPGATAVLAGCPNISVYIYRALQVNSDTGIWLQQLENKTTGLPATPIGADSSPAPRDADTAARPAPLSSVPLPALSKEESSYFEQL